MMAPRSHAELLAALVGPAPVPLTYRELGLPDDWEPRWKTETPDSLSYFLWKLSEEIWHRTNEQPIRAAVAEAELAQRRQPTSQGATLDLESAVNNELFQMAEQATLVGWALAHTVSFAGDLEAWTQAAMAYAGLKVLDPEERRAAHERAVRAYDAIERLQGRGRVRGPASESPAEVPDG